MGIGSKLDFLINSRGTNVNKLALATGVKASTIYSIIRRDNTKVDLEDLQKICDELGVTLDFFSANAHHSDSTEMPYDDLTAIQPEERPLITTFRSLNDENKARVVGYAESKLEDQRSAAKPRKIKKASAKAEAEARERVEAKELERRVLDSITPKHGDFSKLPQTRTVAAFTGQSTIIEIPPKDEKTKEPDPET